MIVVVAVLAGWVVYASVGLATMMAIHRSPRLLNLAGDITTAGIMWPLLWLLAALSWRSTGEGAQMVTNAAGEISKRAGSG